MAQSNVKSFSGKMVKGVTSKKLEINYAIGKGAKIIFRAAFLIGLGFVMLYPILFMLSEAFKASVDAYDPTVIWLPKNFSTEALQLAAETMHYGESVWNTVKILVPSVLLQLLSTLVVAYGFARFKFKGRNVLFGLLIFTMIVPIQTYMIPLYVNFKGLGMLNSPVAFYVMSVFGMGIRSGLYIYIIRQFFRNMPPEIEEAALIDGCGHFKTFWRVMVPNVIPALVTVLVFSVVWYWNDYYMASMFYNKNFPVSVNLTFLATQVEVSGPNIMPNLSSTELWLLKDSILACGCLLTIAPLLVMYIFAQKFFTESIDRTGIVG